MELFPVLIAISLVFVVLLLLCLTVSYTFFYFKKRNHAKTSSPQGYQGGHIYIPHNPEQKNKKNLGLIDSSTKKKITVLKSLDKNQQSN